LSTPQDTEANSKTKLKTKTRIFELPEYILHTLAALLPLKKEIATSKKKNCHFKKEKLPLKKEIAHLPLRNSTKTSTHNPQPTTLNPNSQTLNPKLKSK
jgi:hypothetical protein